MSNLFELQDTKGTPDIFHDYSKSVKDGKLPLIIDNGKKNTLFIAIHFSYFSHFRIISV